MKKLIYASLIGVVLSSCTIVRVPSVQVSSALDYQKSGIFLTESNSVSFNYEPVASLSALQISGYATSDKVNKTFTEDVYGTSFTGPQRTTNKFIQASREDVLNELCKKAIEKGANGIINLSIKYIPRTTDTYSGYEATGMAIKK